MFDHVKSFKNILRHIFKMLFQNSEETEANFPNFKALDCSFETRRINEQSDG